MIIDYLFKKVSIYPIAVFRIFFGILSILEIYIYYFKYNFIHDYYLNPTFHFKYVGFEWVPNLNNFQLKALLLTLCISNIFIVIGLFYRVFSLLSFSLFFLLFFMESSCYLNHWYFFLLLYFFVAIIPMHKNLSIDTLIGVTKKSTSIENWSYLLIQFQTFLVIFFSGVVKINNDWITGNTILSFMDYFRNNPLVVIYYKLLGNNTEKIISIGTILLEILGPLLLISKKTRLVGFILLTIFLLQNAYILYIGTFPFLSILCILLFFNYSKITTTQEINSEIYLNGKKIFVMVFITLYVLFQLIVPCKVFMYKDYLWQGTSKTNFSWNMFLGIPIGHISYKLCFNNVECKSIDPLNYGITLAQKKKLIYNTASIIQFGNYLCKNYTSSKVYAISYLSINKRPLQEYVNPSINLCDCSNYKFQGSTILTSSYLLNKKIK